MRLLQIVPAATTDGVGGYAGRLGEALAGRGLAVDTLAAQALDREADASVIALPQRSPEALVEALERWWEQDSGRERAVLLHYVGYGYQPRGCPVWLVTGLGRWCARRNGRFLATFFHEVNAFGPPWRSSFWLSPLQRRLAAALAGMSGGLATSLPLYRDALHRWVPRRAIAVLPVFSAVGEPEPGEILPLAARPRRLALLGAAANRRRAYGEHRADLAAACDFLGIEEIADLGPGAEMPPAEVAGRPVRWLGTLPAAGVRRELLASSAGFLAYPADFLPKSTVFAAYCAHGLVPVCAGQGPARQGRREAAPAAGEHYLPPRPRSATTPAELQALAGRALDWYKEHDLARQLKFFTGWLASGHSNGLSSRLAFGVPPL